MTCPVLSDGRGCSVSQHRQAPPRPERSLLRQRLELERAGGGDSHDRIGAAPSAPAGVVDRVTGADDAAVAPPPADASLGLPELAPHNLPLTTEEGPEGTVTDLRPVKEAARRLYPPGHAVRALIEAESDVLPRREGLAKLEVIVRLVWALRGRRS